MSQASFVSENARLDRAYLAGEVGEFVRSQAEAARKELDDGDSKSGNGSIVGREVKTEMDRDAIGARSDGPEPIERAGEVGAATGSQDATRIPGAS